MSALTFYFAWCQQTDTAYSSAFARFDERVFDFNLEHDEGQIPKLTIQVINPRIGLLAPGRAHWAWLSYSPDETRTTLVPLFFGRLVGVPTSILANVVEMQFIARPPDYIPQKQTVAASLKVLPQYDPLFFDPQKRDDPDAILEGHSLLYHVGRTDSTVSASDILLGEDGTIAFAASDVFYDSVQIKLLQSPLTAVNVKAEVSWQQQWRGRFFVGQWSFPTLGSEAFVGDWPKSGASLGGGYWAGMAYAGEVDPTATMQYLTNWTANASVSHSWTNGAKEHAYGDTMSISSSYSYPVTASGIPFQYITVSSVNIPGMLNPYAEPPLNQPAHTEVSQFAYRQFSLDGLGKTAKGVLDIAYQADRKRSERVDLTVQAAVQPILIDPLITEDTETLTLKSGDLSAPLVDLRNWSSVAGQPVALGQLIFPDNPLVAGQTSSQICITAGMAGTVEPVFSNVAGVTTNDGTVVWSSCGATTPPDMAQDWQRLAPIPLGALMIPKPIMGVGDAVSIQAPTLMNYPPSGAPMTIYQILCQSGDAMPGSTMMECTAAGIFGGLSIAQAVFHTFTNPSGQSLFICVTAGTSGEFHLTFNETPGARTTDGTAVWQCIGAVALPIGGVPGLTPARSFFPSDRGQLSLQHLICRARAKLRRRARAVQVDFDARFEAAAAISCRMNASVIDARLPGGGVSGKIIAYKLMVNGDSGKIVANVTLGCSIGQGGTVSAAPGTPTYVTAGYVQSSYQQMTGKVVTVAPSGLDEVAYTPPIELVVDDGLTFPLAGAGDAILSSQWHGVNSTINQGNIEAFNEQLLQDIQQALRGNPGAGSMSVTGPGGTASQTYNFPTVDWSAINFQIQQSVLQSTYQGTSMWYELVLKPLTGGPYAAAYVVQTAPLIVPKTIDLSAPSLGG